MSKYSFFVVGAAKCGTTSLYELLCRENKISRLRDKEPHFFGEHTVWGQEKFKDVDEYHENILDSGLIAGDFSTSYLYSEKAAEQIYEYNPHAKILIFLRNPYDRAISLYNHQLRSMRENISTSDEAFDAEKGRIANGWSYGFHYMESGLYYQQVKRYMDVFGREKVCVVPMKGFVTGEADEIIGNFLGVKEFSTRELSKENSTGAPKNRALQILLEREYYGKSILRKIIGGSFIKKIRMNNVGKKVMPTSDKYLHYHSEDLKKLYDLLGWDETCL